MLSVISRCATSRLSTNKKPKFQSLMFYHKRRKLQWCDIEGILPKGHYLTCVSMAGRAHLAGYHRHMDQWKHATYKVIIASPFRFTCHAGNKYFLRNTCTKIILYKLIATENDYNRNYTLTLFVVLDDTIINPCMFLNKRYFSLATKCMPWYCCYWLYWRQC